MTDRIFRNLDWMILVPVLLLIGMGLLTLYSVEHVPPEMKDAVPGSEGRFFARQLIWAAFGLIVLVMALALPFKYYEGLATLFYAAGIALLVMVLLQSSSRWLVFGGFRLQPSEFMKIGVIFFLARYLSGKGSDPNRFRVLTLSSLLALLPLVLVAKQPDLGTALVYPALLIPMLYWRGLSENALILFLSPIVMAFLTVYSPQDIERWDYPVFLLIFFILILVIAYRKRHNIVYSISLVGINLAVMLIVPTLLGKLKIYQQKRILAFLHPESDILGTGWQVYQSKVAIGSGGFFGKQYLQGTQKLLAFLPERHSDFVYSVLSEELGFLGAIVVPLLFSIVIIRGLYLATNVKNRFASLAIIGICAYFAFHVFINIGMTVGFAPVTGLPLPFLSYGGSSMMISCFLIGVLLNFSVRFYEY
jgi:rod shape determining protein RodA